ncbi:MAG: serine/threonine-protein kinase [Chloroflexota bacterium]
MAHSTGEVLNSRYRVVKLLGQGGFGAVYRAWDTTFQTQCAVKHNTETSSEAQRQFAREAQMLYSLRHPNLPQVKDYFQDPGKGQYLVMDFIEGQDLQEKLEQAGGPLPEAQALAWIEQVCEALVYLHAQPQPVIHRDIKPANIKINPQGEAILVDFGIAKKFDPKLRTTVGARAVTPGYSPFEQYGKAPTDVRTDVYALGATLYALLTGQEPTDSIARMAGQELPTPRSLNPKVPAEIEKVILHAMQIMPDQRYQSVAAFKAELHRVFVALQPSVVTHPAQDLAPPAAAGAAAKAAPTPARPPTWWTLVVQGSLAVLTGLLLVLSAYIDPYQMGRTLSIFALVCCAAGLIWAWAAPALRWLQLLLGAAGMLLNLILLTIDFYIWEDYTSFQEKPFLILGLALALPGLAELLRAFKGGSWRNAVMGGFLLVLSLVGANLETLQDNLDIYLSTPLGALLLLGGAAVIAFALFRQYSQP